MKFYSFFYLQVSQKILNFAPVIELQRHIEILLLENECVIVPDFGGFITHKVSARYDDTDKLFLPPFKTLGFNPQLKINDSLLAQSYVEAFDISLPEATRRIEKEVEELKETLNEDGKYTLENLGTLVVNQDGNYEFTPCEAGIQAPDFYGLSYFTFKHLKDEKPLAKESLLSVANIVSETTESTVQDDFEEDNTAALLEFTDTDDDNHSIEIKMSWIRNTVAVAAAIVAFFMLSTPIANSNWSNQTMSKLQNSLFFKLIPQDTNYTPSEPVVDEFIADTKTASHTTTEKAIPVTQPATPVQQDVLKQPETKTSYCIVLASQVKRANAEKFVESLHREGFKEAIVMVHNNVTRVVCGEYATEVEAHRHLGRFYSKPEYSEAWIYKKVDVVNPEP